MDYAIYGALALGLGIAIRSILDNRNFNKATENDAKLKSEIKAIEDKKALLSSDIELLDEQIKNNKLEVKKPNEVEDFWNKK